MELINNNFIKLTKIERKRLVYSNTNNKLEEEYIYTLDKLRVKRVLK